MSYTSAYGFWIESEGATLFQADKPVSTFRAQVLADNIYHLRDTSTMERISHLTMVGESIAATDSTGSLGFDNASPLQQYVTPWTVLGANKLARPVLRVGAYRNSAGTSYISAGLFPLGVRQDAYGKNAVAFWPEVAFTATTATTIVLEDAADIKWEARAFPPEPGSGYTDFGGEDPENDGTLIPSRSSVLMLTLALFVRHTGTSETRVTLVQLREFSGP